ncbi:hypothetical protein Taro_043103 [Colocasia esculenta]|uniref:Protein-lysine N-methyltransferase Taro_043103 n=1 Tax=Colocasia esculenta TaxID=4460 RepID=A0A843WIK0_COLES|nr:hypothetical protein [Colocasia esculenta]
MAEVDEKPTAAVAAEVGEDDDDDAPKLSARALEALKEFLAGQQLSGVPTGGEDEEEGAGAGSGAAEEVRLVSEDWGLSQFWYDRETAETVAAEVVRLCAAAGSLVACVACPTLYAYLKKKDPSMSAQLLEYDRRFERYGGDFVFYDYNQPGDLPSKMHHAYGVVVADPPYLSKECLEKVAQTISFLARPQESYILLLTGEVQMDIAAELLDVHPCGFRPQHTSKLGNEFRLFTNYNPKERLGGWQQDA